MHGGNDTERELGRRGADISSGEKLLLPRLYRVAVLARHDLNLGRLDHLVRFHFEVGVLDNESPDIVA